MNKQEIDLILSDHIKWLDDSETGERASLRGANLRGANLSDANLSYTNLSCADLRDADLSDADLRGANLRGANLSDANLSYTNLSCADLRDADLRDADLRGADLSGANLRRADLSGADLDYSCWPLSCCSKDVKVNRKIAAQLAAHFCVMDCDDADYQKARKAILKFAKTSHRAADLGLEDVK